MYKQYHTNQLSLELNIAYDVLNNYNEFYDTMKYIAAYRSTTLNCCSKHSKWVPTYDKINEADALGSAFFVTFYLLGRTLRPR